VRVYAESGFVDPNKPIRKYTKEELQDFLYKEPVKVKVDGVNLTYEGLIPKVQKSFLSKDPDALQPHIRAFVDRAVTFTACPECDGTRLRSHNEITNHFRTNQCGSRRVVVAETRSGSSVTLCAATRMLFRGWNPGWRLCCPG
jgi:excinuclease UvrABC ATPase subunit